MSEIITDKLTGRATAGDVTITGEGGSGTMQLQQGVSKAHCTIDAYQATTGTTSSFNISSVTDDGTGLWDIAYTNNMDTRMYSAAMMGTSGGDTDTYTRSIMVRTTIHTDQQPVTMLTSGCGFLYRYVNASAHGNYGYAWGCHQIFGDLA